MAKPIEVMVYRDLLMVVYEPAVARNKLSLLFASNEGDRVKNIFHPSYVAVGNRMSVRNGRHEYEDRVIVYERGWIFKKLERKSEEKIGTTTYTLCEYEVEFTRNRAPAIPHTIEDNLVLAPYSDVFALYSGTSQNPGELNWGYIGEVKLKDVLEKLKELESKHA